VARSIGNELPPAVVALLANDDDIEWRIGLTVLVLTTGVDAWPHLAMVSLGEVVAVGPRTLRLALWPTSTAARNLWREQRATLALVHDAAAYYLRCTSRRGPDLEMPDGGRLACFGLQIEDVSENQAPYATLTGGVTFRLNDVDGTLPRWLGTRAALRAMRIGSR